MSTRKAKHKKSADKYELYDVATGITPPNNPWCSFGPFDSRRLALASRDVLAHRFGFNLEIRKVGS